MKEITRSRLNVLCEQLVTLAEMVRKDTDEVLSTNNHIDVIKHFNELRRVNEQIKEAREALGDIADDLSTQRIPELMRAAGVKTITIEGVGRVTVSHRFSCSILEGKKEQAFSWLRGNQLDALIIETVNSATLSAAAKSRLAEDGLDMPNDIFKVGTMPYTSITKAG